MLDFRTFAKQLPSRPISFGISILSSRIWPSPVRRIVFDWLSDDFFSSIKISGARQVLQSFLAWFYNFDGCRFCPPRVRSAKFRQQSFSPSSALASAILRAWLISLFLRRLWSSCAWTSIFISVLRFFFSESHSFHSARSSFAVCSNRFDDAPIHFVDFDWRFLSFFCLAAW